MMKNYVIEKNGEQWDVVEKQTSHIVKTCDGPFAAQIHKTRLNNGAGFAGWTPRFFVNNFSKPAVKAENTD
jgi:hypothetical protein